MLFLRPLRGAACRRPAAPAAPAAARRYIQIATTAGGSGCNVFTSGNVYLHPQWLRERCLSEKSVQEKTRQPLRQPHEYAWPMVVSHAEFDGDARGLLLNVRFGDGHASTFVVADLEREARSVTAHGIQQRDNQIPEAVLWRQEQPQRFKFNELVNEVKKVQTEEELGRNYFDHDKEHLIPETNAGPMHALTKRLMTHGHVVVTDVPGRDMMVADFAQALTRFQGYSSVRATNWGPVFNVRSVPDKDLHDIAYTSLALPPHVDNPYRNPNPGFQLLHALENKCILTGGSLAVDGFEVARQLRKEDPEMFRVLSEVPVRWENNGGDGSTALVFFGPQISLNPSSGEVEQIRYSNKSGGYTPAISDVDEMDLLFRARRRFAELLNEESNTTTFRLQEGEIWMFNNLRVLHGREAFDVQEGNRHFQGCYIDHDGVQTAYFRSKYLLQAEEEEEEKEV